MSLLSSILPDSWMGPNSFLGSLFGVGQEETSLSDRKIAKPTFVDDILSTLSETFKPSPGAVPDAAYSTWQDRAGLTALDVIPRLREQIFGKAPDIWTTPEDAFMARWKERGSAELQDMMTRVKSGEFLAIAGEQGLAIQKSIESAINGLMGQGGPSGAPAASPGPDTAAPAGNPQDYAGTVVTWGDSHAGGVAHAVAGGRARVQNRGTDSVGLGGAQSLDGIPQGAVVLMNIGTNDLTGGLRTAGPEAIDKYAERVIAQAEKVKAQGGTPVIVGIQSQTAPYTDNAAWNAPGFVGQYNEAAAQLNAALQRRAEGAGITFSATEGRIPASERASDNLHYTSKGYSHIAANALQDAGLMAARPRLSGPFNQTAPSPVDRNGLERWPGDAAEMTEGASLGGVAMEALTGAHRRHGWSRESGADNKPAPGQFLGEKYVLGYAMYNGQRRQVVGILERHQHNETPANAQKYSDGFGSDGVTPDPGKGGGYHNGVTAYLAKPGYELTQAIVPPSGAAAPARTPEREAPPQSGTFPRAQVSGTGRHVDMAQDIDLYIPPGLHPNADGSYNVIYQFQGSGERNIANANVNAAVVTLNLQPGGQTSTYTNAFKDPNSFRELMASTQSTLRDAGMGDGRIGRLALSGFSAGYAAVREILKHPGMEDRVDAVFLQDGLFTSDKAGEGVDPAKLDVMARYAERAKRGEKVMGITHSYGANGKWATTSEVADALLARVGVGPESGSGTGPGQMKQRYHADQGGLHVSGYESSHASHAQYMGMLTWPTLQNGWGTLDASVPAPRRVASSRFAGPSAG